jgi:hypothetical protein
MDPALPSGLWFRLVSIFNGFTKAGFEASAPSAFGRFGAEALHLPKHTSFGGGMPQVD